jgi:hypothetical protein
MTPSKSLPARPSLESLRKQAKTLAREIAAGDAGAIERARLQLPRVALPLTQRNAQLVIAREYGFAGWQDLTVEVSKGFDESGAPALGDVQHHYPRVRTCRRAASMNTHASGARKACSGFSTRRSPEPS